MSDRNLKATLAEEFADKEYAHSYMHQHVLERLATQLYATRIDRGLSQGELAQLSGVPQSKISRLECAEVESFTVSTALKLAKALDVALALEFEPFSALIRNVDRSSCADLLVPSRERDLPGFQAVNRLIQRVHVPGIRSRAVGYLDVLPSVPVTDIGDVRFPSSNQ